LGVEEIAERLGQLLPKLLGGELWFTNNLEFRDHLKIVFQN
jgi:fructosamine-3-kinase